MMARNCRFVRRQLSAFHDGELPVGDQIAVQAHLRGCPVCAAEAREFDELGSLVRAGALSVHGTDDVWRGLPSTVVSRMKAEDAESIIGWTGRLFEDLHLVWAALGATAATVACVALIVTIFHFAVISLAGSNENPIVANAHMNLPSASAADAPAARPNEADEDLVVPFNVVLSKEGRITALKPIDENGHETLNHAERQEVANLMDAISKARFEPARPAGSALPVAVNMVWLYASLTVKAKMPDLPGPAVVQPPPQHHQARPTISTIMEQTRLHDWMLSA